MMGRCIVIETARANMVRSSLDQKRIFLRFPSRSIFSIREVHATTYTVRLHQLREGGIQELNLGGRETPAGRLAILNDAAQAVRFRDRDHIGP
jgi:hypothetical protein